MKMTVKTGEREHEVTVERRDGLFRVVVDGTEHLVDARRLEADFHSIMMAGRSYELSIEPDGDRYHVRHGASQRTVSLTDATRRAREGLSKAHGPETVVTVMPGKVVRVLVAEGDEVEAGQGLVVVEAMKMENEIGAPRAGRVKSVDVTPGQNVETGARLVVLE